MPIKVPKRRFGRTEERMPVLTCGGMRYQQSWNDLSPGEIDKKGQENLEATIHYALDHGINHIETARGYGSSEMQLGWVLPRIERDSMLVQTKIGVKETGREFLEAFETSMNYLKLDHVDFLSIHGINLPEHIGTCLKKGGALEAARQLQKEGRAKHIGFSTHGGPEVVLPVCETGEFDYVNLHWYFIYHPLHWPMVEAAAKQDMGLFIISPNDKGGKLYDPPEKLRALCEPLTPMQWNDLYTLRPQEVHTLSIGASCPSDFDQHIEAVTTHWDSQALVSEIEERLQGAMREALGDDWCRRWMEGLPHYPEVPGERNIRETLRLWSYYKGLDMLAFAKMRYNLLGSADHWFPGGKIGDLEGVDLASVLKNSPFAERIPAVLKEAHAVFDEAPAKRLSESE
jgi:uncharacterized protein